MINSKVIVPRPSTELRMTQARKVILLVFFLLTSFLTAAEKETNKQDALRHYQLEGIRVVAEKPQETIGSIEVKSFDPRQTTTEMNMAEAIGDVSGLDASTGGKAGTDLRIRGFKNDQIKFMLDGRPLGGGYFGNVDLSTIPVSEIKEVQVLKGPVSSLYGSDTMGGVVNIITRGANSEKWLKAGLQSKRNNTNKIYLSSSHDVGEWDYWIYASRFHTDGFMMSDNFQATPYENGAVRNYTARNQYDFQSKINFTLFDFHSIGIQVGYTFMDKKEIPSSIYENRLRDFTKWHRMQLSGIGSFQISPYLKSDVNIYYDQYDDTYVEYNAATGEIYPQWPSYLESWIFGVNQKNNWEISASARALFGYRFEKEVYNRKDNGNYPDWTSNNQQKHNGFAQMEYNWKNFTFSGGSGISYFRPKGIGSWQANPEPAFGIYWEDLCKLSLAFSSNTRYPNLHELFSSSSGNLDLEEQRARKYELTSQIPIILSGINGSFSSSFFYNDITNLIDKVGDIYQNLYKVQNYGTEFTLNFDWLWEHKIDYAYIKYLDDSNLSLLEVPQNTVNITETKELPWQIKLRYKADWKDIRYADNDAGQIVTLDSYWLHSIYFHKNWKDYKFSVGMENILDKNYLEKFGYPGPGVNFVFNLEVGM
ncbi:MAG: TonB-dependent receptor plug domain-containing protein [Candidatus Cloacimonetes bacterium]|nr:TonB-dependent receptor plug domain-containing protein [Candidatus Cloacimonadota bacterium]MCF7814835.1 TonB-dependent receptor plug domain-containing protein [Candidatus Cloacimonadota bacterium]MCF7867891.1 TonB-dependent receptor plug domain-containing protein [Candidatus Cloacimonadota bacterium]MCF7883710.1 TonB-dependent receptor plug domain-containing protein [Candidatus Cloacimonadota bacterium]